MRGTRRVVITGATGFVGRHVVQRFLRAEWEVLALVRPGSAQAGAVGALSVVERELTATDDLMDVLRAGDVVVHLAGRAHVMRDHAPDAAAAFRTANVAPTEMLCESAARAGVARFVLVSSAKVFGEGRERPYTVTDPPAPSEPYARSKAEAERVVREAGDRGAFDWSILRPPFVYGPAGKGNFPRLIGLARLSTKLPLPLASIENRRSIIFVGNLADLLLRAVTHPKASRCVLLPTDQEDVSTPELLRAIAAALGSRARLFGCPLGILRAGARLAGRSAEMDRLTESLRLDSRSLRDALEWQPPFTLAEGLALSIVDSSADLAPA